MTSTDLFPLPHCPEPLQTEPLIGFTRLPDYPVWRDSLGRYMTLYEGRRWCIEDIHTFGSHPYRVILSSAFVDPYGKGGWTEHLSILVDPEHDSAVIVQMVANRFLEFVTASLL